VQSELTELGGLPSLSDFSCYIFFTMKFGAFSDPTVEVRGAQQTHQANAGALVEPRAGRRRGFPLRLGRRRRRRAAELLGDAAGGARRSLGLNNRRERVSSGRGGDGGGSGGGGAGEGGVGQDVLLLGLGGGST
jgi:hypothetical protein